MRQGTFDTSMTHMRPTVKRDTIAGPTDVFILFRMFEITISVIVQQHVKSYAKMTSADGDGGLGMREEYVVIVPALLLALSLGPNDFRQPFERPPMIQFSRWKFASESVAMIFEAVFNLCLV
jgi:hypothetical protein